MFIIYPFLLILLYLLSKGVLGFLGDTNPWICLPPILCCLPPPHHPFHGHGVQRSVAPAAVGHTAVENRVSVFQSSVLRVCCVLRSHLLRFVYVCVPRLYLLRVSLLLCVPCQMQCMCGPVMFALCVCVCLCVFFVCLLQGCVGRKKNNQHPPCVCVCVCVCRYVCVRLG